MSNQIIADKLEYWKGQLNYYVRTDTKEYIVINLIKLIIKDLEDIAEYNIKHPDNTRAFFKT